MATQIHWDFKNRAHWPRVLDFWARPNPWNNPTYNVGFMRYKGHLVLDYSGEPINDFRIPLTISSRVEGLRVQAWLRSDNRLTLADIEARMWTKNATGGGKKPFYGGRCLSKRESLSLVKVGLANWMFKAGNDGPREYMDSLRTPQQKANNLALGRDLTRGERAIHEVLSKKENNALTREERLSKIEEMTRMARGEEARGTSPRAANAELEDPVAATSSEDESDGSPEPESEPEHQAFDADNAVADPADADSANADPAEIDPADILDVDSDFDDPYDCRNFPPVNPLEESLLQEALEATVDHFIELTGQQPAPTDRGENYFSQWAELQAEFRRLWIARYAPAVNPDAYLQFEDIPGVPPVPRLRRRGCWTIGISYFEFSVIEDDEDDEDDL